MVKIIDMSWIADKSLDLYCANVATEYSSPKKVRYCSKSVSAAVGKIFNSVLSSAVEEYSPKFDYVFIIVPCYPITRMEHASIITRFICKNSDFLSEMGVSSNQFQEMFEKFLSQKCNSEYITRINSNTFILNGRNVLFHDWVDAIKTHFGTSLVDDSKSFPFDSNPDFINTMEYNLEIFTKTGEDIRFRLGEILKNLT